MSGKSLIIGMVLIAFLFSSGFVRADFSAGDGAQAFNNDDLVAGVGEGESDSPIKTYPACWDELTQCYGDSDNDGWVKGSDFLALKSAWYKYYSQPAYNPCADFDRDGCVDGADFLTLKSNWYKVVPADCIPGDPCEIYPQMALVWVCIDDSGVPGHEGFTGYMSKYETTNAQYCQYLNSALADGLITVYNDVVYAAGDTSHEEPYFDTYAADSESQISYSGGSFSVRSRDGYDMSNHPVVEVSWYGATAFCDYYGYRLPTELEWQAVADYDGSYTYGCGTTINQSKANYDYANPLGLSSYPYTSPVGYYPAYGYGMCDMAGNVREWTSSLWGPYDSYRVLRGGCWNDVGYYCAVSSPLFTVGLASSSHDDLGFRVILDLQIRPDMVLIPGGEFQMGDHFYEGWWYDELPVHPVYVASFYMSKYEVTNAQYCAYLNSALGGSIYVSGGVVYGSGNNQPYCDTHNADTDSQIDYSGGVFSVRTKGGRDMSKDPMVEVSWYGAVAYCNWRSQEEGHEQCYNLSTWACDFSRKGYRLPTEAEWEYAARGGLSGRRFPWGDTITHSQANYYSSSSYSYDVSSTRGYHPTWNDGIYPYTSLVGSFSPNGYGLYDMTGNVREWCNDWYSGGYYSSSPVNNPTGPATGSSRVLRGGSCFSLPYISRVASRFNSHPLFCIYFSGFRLSLDLN